MSRLVVVLGYEGSEKIVGACYYKRVAWGDLCGDTAILIVVVFT